MKTKKIIDLTELIGQKEETAVYFLAAVRNIYGEYLLAIRGDSDRKKSEKSIVFENEINDLRKKLIVLKAYIASEIIKKSPGGGTEINIIPVSSLIAQKELLEFLLNNHPTHMINMIDNFTQLNNYYKD